jgi:hypothetical protein
LVSRLLKTKHLRQITVANPLKTANLPKNTREGGYLHPHERNLGK